MNIWGNNKEKCTGCTACANVCAKNCISMKSDSLGFKYPIIDNKLCVKCGLCKRVCPIDNDLPYIKGYKQIFYGISRDEKVIMSSSSGGAFSELVHLVEQQKGQYHCYAAAFTNEEVAHVCISNTVDLYKQKKSKYTQSVLGDTFRKIKVDVENNLFVVFAGTPCQVDGLKSFLRYRHYDNLLTIDLLCTGVCSPMLFTNHIRYLQQERGQNIVNYDMRKKCYKNGVWHIMDTEIVFQNGVCEEKEKNYFVGCFRQHIAYRDSCYQCKYTNSNRVGDITLGDYWKFTPQFTENESKGISVIIANTDKGKIWANRLRQSMLLEETSIDDIRIQQPALRHPVNRPKFKILKDITTIEGSVKFMKRYYRGALKIRLLSAVSHALPKKLSIRLKNIYYQIT